MLAKKFFNLLVICLVYFLRITFANEQTCAVLYTGENQKDNQFVMTAGQHISTFEEHYLPASQDVWNFTRSIKVSEGCTFTSCNDSYFGSFCKVFQSIQNAQGSVNLSPELFSIGSAKCICQSICQCNNIRFKDSECARAYLDGGCESCNTYYLDFKNKTGEGYIENRFRNNISAFVIRPECELEVFEGDDFDGDSKMLKGVVQGWNEAIGSYICDCTSPLASSDETRQPKNESNLIDVPNSVDNIKTLLREHEGHEGLISSLKSIKYKRSPKNAYILLLGESGSGKSSTVNMLFGNPIPGRGGRWRRLSYTSEIKEYRIPVPLNELKIKNSELRIIEIPGFGDTRGLEIDANSLASLEQFLNEHEELSKYIPNVILIVSKFNENRISGGVPSFVRMLRGLNSFMDRFTDKKFSNVVFVLSHFMMQPRQTTQRPGKLLKQFKTAIEEYSLIPKPITTIFAENRAHDQGLSKLKGSYLLPNGDFYPQNLFEKIKFATKSGGDPIGEAIFQSAFLNTDDLKVSRSYSFPRIHSKHPKATRHLEILARDGYLRHEYESEVSRTLAVGFESINPRLKRLFPGSLRYLQQFFFVRNIYVLTGIPRTSVRILKFFKDIRINEAILETLQNSFSMKIPELPQETMMVGFGYDVVENMPLLTSPFKNHNKILSDIIYKIPDFMSSRIENQKKRLCHVFGSVAEYDRYTLQNMNAQYFSRENRFVKSTKAGYNILRNPGENILSAVKEYRNYELLLNDNYHLTEEFVDTLKQLPIFNTSNYEVIEIWKTFFKSFGTHVVKSIHGGGSIEIQMKATDPFNQTAVNAIFDIIDAAEDITSMTEIQTSYEYTLKFNGGDVNFHTGSFSGMSASDAADLMEGWKNSLQYNPIVLDSDIKLIPISEVAKKVGMNISVEIERATCAFLNLTMNCSTQGNRTSVALPGSVKTRLSQTGSDANQCAAILDVIRNEFNTSRDRFENAFSEIRNHVSNVSTARDTDYMEELEWQTNQQGKMDATRLRSLQRYLSRVFRRSEKSVICS